VAPAALMIMFHYEDPVVSALTPLLWHGSKVSAPLQLWISYFCPYLRLLEFVAGALAAKAYMCRGDTPGRAGGDRVILALCLAWCAIVVLVPPISTLPWLGTLISNFIFAPALALLLYGCATRDTWLSRVLVSRPLLFMGDISYSVYIWSWSAMVILQFQFNSSAPSALACFNSSVKLAAIVVVTTVIAHGSYHLIEMPARRHIRSLLSGTHFRRSNTRHAYGVRG
jgi:peptidoglycan/LPS O-acetylase OafA/YrhL